MRRPIPPARRRRAAVWRVLALAAAVVGATPAALAQAKPETLSVCAACHGPGGNSVIPQFPSLAGQPKLFIENQLVLIREGLRDIAPMKDVLAKITDEEIVELAKHYAAQPLLPTPGTAQAAKLQRGAQLSAKNLCGTCHLPSFAGQSQVPRLAGQREDYLLVTMKQLRDKPGPGRDTIMASTLRGMSDADLGSLAHYLALFKP